MTCEFAGSRPSHARSFRGAALWSTTGVILIMSGVRRHHHALTQPAIPPWARRAHRMLPPEWRRGAHD
eukprot:7043109-Pyramimonas_sp.AAC.1